jgi:hypothetical protein
VFPIPSNQRLPFLKIADYWSREMKPSANSDELFDLLVKAWWRGELVASGAERVNVLKAIQKYPPSRIVFESDQGIKELPDDGSVEVRCVVPLPRSNPDSWKDSDCAEAFQSIAQIWDTCTFELVTPVICRLELTEAEFTRWVRSYRYMRGAFWASGRGDDGPPADKVSRSKLAQLAQEYYESAAEGRSQSGFEDWLETKNIHGPRGDVRSAYKEVAGPLQPGRPTKKELARVGEKENSPELNAPQIANNALGSDVDP